MIRTAAILRKLALIAAGGSFLPGLPTAAHAGEAAPIAAAPAPPATLAERAARLNIAPLRLELDASKPTATLMLTNTSERPLPVQARLFSWSQEGGEDHFAPSAELTISPSIISIPAGATQVVRLLRSGAASPGEKRFRLAVDQLPDPALAQSGEAEARLRFTIPVFLDRDKDLPAQLAWRLLGDRLEVANSGGLTARIVGIEVKTAAGRAVGVERNSLRYVQGKTTISWPLTGGCALGPVTVTAQIDGRTADAQVSPTCG